MQIFNMSVTKLMVLSVMMVVWGMYMEVVTSQAYIVRPNYGVAFVRKKPVLNSNSFWHQTFAIRFEKPVKIPTVPFTCGGVTPDILLDRESPSNGTTRRNKRSGETLGDGDMYFEYSGIPIGEEVRDEEDTTSTEEEEEATQSFEKNGKEKRATQKDLTHIPWRTSHRMCTRFADMLQKYDEELLQLQKHIDANERTVADLLEPTLKLNRLPGFKDSRTPRAFLDLVGKILRPLFGVATTDDIRALATHVGALEKHVKDTAEDTKEYRLKLDSLTVTTNRRITLALKKINQNFELINQTVISLTALTEQVRGMDNQIKLLWRDMELTSAYSMALMRASLMNIQTIETITVESDQRVQGIQTLLQGYLPIQLVPTALLKEALGNVTLRLQTEYPNFKLAYNNLYQYYKTPGVVYTHTDQYLYIKVRLPLISESTQFDLYQVLVATIPVTSAPGTPGVANKDGTTITGTTEYFGVSRDGYYYLEMTQSQYGACIQEHAGHCAQLMPMKEMETQSPSCTMALFKDNAQQVAEVCKVSYRFNVSIPAAVIDLGLNSLLITSQDKTWTRKCFGVPPVTIPGCSFCIVQPPCGCAIQTSTFYIPPTLYACTDLHSESTQKHFVNLHMIQSFSDIYAVKNISGSTSFDKEFGLKLPEMKMEYEKRGIYAEREAEYVVDLAKTAKLMKEEQVPYYSPVDYLMDTSLHGFTDTSKFMVIVLQISMVVSIVISMVISLYAMKKVRDIRAEVLKLNFIITPDTTVEPPPPSEDERPRRRRRRREPTESELDV